MTAVIETEKWLFDPDHAPFGVVCHQKART